jgi:hypothetical protein
MGVDMIDPETRYALWKYEQFRRDRGLERRRSRFQAVERDDLPDLASENAEESACCGLEEAS